MMRLKSLSFLDDYRFWLAYHSTLAFLNAICAAMSADASVWFVRFHGLLMFVCVVFAVLSWYWIDEEGKVNNDNA